MALPIDLEAYESYLRKNTNLMEGSIILYLRTARNFLSLYNQEINEKNLNEFVSEGFRAKNCFYLKYALKHLLAFSGNKKLYNKIVKIKVNPKKRMGVYLSEDMVKNIIRNISDDKFQDIATLQFATGARAREIITLREENIDFNVDGIVRVRLIGKRAKPRITFLNKAFIKVLKQYLKNRPGHLFFDHELHNLDLKDQEKKINNMRTYYYLAIRDSAGRLGHENFGTHDFRRNVVEILKKRKVHIRTIQKVMGHSDIRTTIRYFDDNPDDIQEAMLLYQDGKDNKD